jgi:hypothetical protein
LPEILQPTLAKGYGAAFSIIQAESLNDGNWWEM